jgi:predicted MFS family arabinose efflux permease
MIRKSLYRTLALIPLLMAALATALVGLGGSVSLATIFVAGWGFAFGAVPVAWTTWVTRTFPDETESAGGVQVAAIQAAIATGAGVGGVLLNASGPRGTFAGSGVVLLLASLTILLGLRPRTAR